MGLRSRTLAALVLLLSAAAGPARAFDPAVLDSVVSVLPLWPGYGQGGTPERPDGRPPLRPPGAEPEGTAVAIKPGGYLVTALHVVARAVEITVRLADGRLRPARLAGRDPATDLALLEIDEDLPVLPIGPEPALGAPVCAIGNQFGLGLSVTCGVVSATRRSGVGFNPIEDFIQTDATVNPGASGGALVDGEGRLVGILSAIFTKDSDADIGVNFAVSTALTLRVVEDLIAHGRVIRARAGLALGELEDAERAELAGVRVLRVTPGGAAERAGVQAGDILTAIADRTIRKRSDATSALQLFRPGERVGLRVLRAGAARRIELILPPYTNGR
jgi:S1-C subfamily serine protease